MPNLLGLDLQLDPGSKMPRKIRELIQDLKNAGFYEISGGGKGSHRKFTHKNHAGAVTLSGKISEDAKIYQERQVKQALEQVKPWKKVIYITSG